MPAGICKGSTSRPIAEILAAGFVTAERAAGRDVRGALVCREELTTARWTGVAV